MYYTRFYTVLFLLFVIMELPAQDDRTNVLMIAIDDLNDWVGCLEGHPQAKTPNIDRLAKMGTLFRNAHCQAPVCNPSRASLMTSLLPSSSGIYFLNPSIEASPVAKKNVTLPKRFSSEGYRVMAAGKLFHNNENKKYFDEYRGSFGGFGPKPKKKISQPHGHPLWDWGVFPKKTSEMPDDKIANWAVGKLDEKFEKPFFLAVGFYRPHVPMYVPQEWFDRHPLEKIKLPEVRGNDLLDLSSYAKDLTTLEHVAPTQEWITSSGQWKHAVQSYLASTTFVDACVGKVLTALEKSKYKDNTIIVLFSDHGFHLGEKHRWAKRSLWEDGTRVPMIIIDPTTKNKNRVCDAPVGLIDIYPTLLELCGLDADSKHEGHSLVPLLKNPDADWKHPAITTFGPGNHTIRTKRWRLIQYNDGSQELYDHSKDKHEWINLAHRVEYTDTIKKLQARIPKNHHTVLGKNSTGHKAFDAAEAKRH